MAGFASAWAAAGLRLFHSLVKLPAMRIGVATGAVEVLPMEDRGGRLQLCRLLVAVGTRNRDVFARELKPSLLVLGKCESRGLVTVDRMAPFAGIEVRRSSKLAGVLVGMAVSAVLEFQLENGVGSVGDVALVASHFCVRPRQGVCGLRVICHRECRRFPSVHGVT